ncbi:MarR family winged helix-turn-helix transcriptional regulator [Paenibacillus sp. GCM10027627]|uniref:MarR family winged helix-turn-helix transcriptional regulator n=1 Tax=unclassified Paenibacillus TaxID=185978 RepID=UPI003638A8D6
MEQMLELFVKNGLRPFHVFPEARELEKSMNSSEVSALVLLHFYGDLTMSEWAELLGAPLSTVTSLSKRLVRKGMIDRRQSEQDQRIIRVRLTAEGKELAAQVKAVMESTIARVQKALTDEELAQFVTLAVKVGKAIQQDGKTEKGKPSKALRTIQIED